MSFKGGSTSAQGLEGRVFQCAPPSPPCGRDGKEKTVLCLVRVVSSGGLPGALAGLRFLCPGLRGVTLDLGL
jgi:hypothetical protein